MKPPLFIYFFNAK